MKSLDVIKHYAGLDTELPGVRRIVVYQQPDGVVFCDNGSGDSHRIAAAILRGQEHIETHSIYVYRLDENVI